MVKFVIAHQKRYGMTERTVETMWIERWLNLPIFHFSILLHRRFFFSLSSSSPFLLCVCVFWWFLFKLCYVFVSDVCYAITYEPRSHSLSVEWLLVSSFCCLYESFLVGGGGQIQTNGHQFLVKSLKMRRCYISPIELFQITKKAQWNPLPLKLQLICTCVCVFVSVYL